jgi:phage portal protein BeeE
MSFLNRLFGAKTAEIEPETKTWSLYIRDDGFVSVAQFTGDSLDLLLTKSVWVYTCATANAEAVASIPPMVQKWDGRTWQRDENPPESLQKLTLRPFGPHNGDWPDWGWSTLLNAVALQYQLVGNSYIVPTTYRKTLRALHMLRLPTSMTVTEDQAGRPIKYEYGGKAYQPSEIVNVLNVGAGSYYDGVSPLAGCSDSLETDYIATSRHKAYLSNRVAPGMVLTVTSKAPLSPTQIASLKAQVVEQYKGADEDGTPMVLGSAVEVSDPPTAQDYDYSATKKAARDEILAAFKVPPPIVGVYENATLQNFKEAQRIWWNRTIGPMSWAIYSALNLQAVGVVYGDNYRLAPDLAESDLGLAVLDARADAAQKLVNLGYTANEAAQRARLDMPHIPELQVYNTQLALAGREDPSDADSDVESGNKSRRAAEKRRREAEEMRQRRRRQQAIRDTENSSQEGREYRQRRDALRREQQDGHADDSDTE